MGRFSTLIHLSHEYRGERDSDSGLPYLEVESKKYIYGEQELKNRVHTYFGST